MIINVNPATEFYNMVNESIVSKYDIDYSGALMHIYESELAYNSIIKSIQLDYMRESEVTDLGGFVIKLIDGLIKLIKMLIEKIISLFKKFSARSKDVDLNNNKFIEMYGRRINRIDPRVKISIEGYEMDAQRHVITGNAIAMSGTNAYLHAKDKILGQHLFSVVRYFKNKEDLNSKLSEFRHALLEEPSKSSSVSDKEFADSLIYKFYGKKQKQDFLLDQATDTIRAHGLYVNSVKTATDLVRRQGDADIRELERQKSDVKRNTISDKAAIEQLQMLMNFRNKIMQDQLLALQTLMKYVDDINRQAKTICIKAMQEN